MSNEPQIRDGRDAWDTPGRIWQCCKPFGVSAAVGRALDIAGREAYVRHVDAQGDAKRLYEEAESELSAAAEGFVARPRFADTLAFAAENVAATSKIASEAFDLVLRNLRIVGRRDLVVLAKQLGRTEDKLERVLQEIEDLRDEVKAGSTAGAKRSASVEELKPRPAKSGSGTKKPATPDRRAARE